MTTFLILTSTAIATITTALAIIWREDKEFYREYSTKLQKIITEQQDIHNRWKTHINELHILHEQKHTQPTNPPNEYHTSNKPETTDTSAKTPQDAHNPTPQQPHPEQAPE